MGNRPKTNRLPWAVALVATAYAAFLLGGKGHEPQTTPLIAERLQSIGELHLVAANFQGVIDHTTSQEAADWAKPIPFADQIVRSATANHGLVEVRGRVDAGIDLTQAKVTTTDRQITVYLPEPTIYEPNVDATVHGQKAGLFYRDENFGLKARRAAAQQMKSSTDNANTMRLAREKAAQTIKSLVLPVDGRPVVCVFGTGGS